MKIRLNSVFVDDQDKALAFYTNSFGFEKQADISMGEYRWLTVVSAEEPHGIELVLEPNVHPAARAYQAALLKDGIPVTALESADVDADYARLSARGVKFTVSPVDAGDTRLAIFADTCGNLIQIYQAP